MKLSTGLVVTEKIPHILKRRRSEDHKYEKMEGKYMDWMT